MIPVKAVTKVFPNHKPPRRTSRGIEITIRDCPWNPSHKPWKFGINISTGWAYCYICKRQGVRAYDVLNIDPSKLPKQTYEVEKQKLIDPPETVSLDKIQSAGLEYLKKRNADLDACKKAGIRWKRYGIPAWTKETTKGRRIHIGVGPGFVIPIYTRGDLVGWQFAPTSRKPKKYLNAPGSKLGSSFFNFDNVSSESRVAVLFEGVFDALRLVNVGIALLTDNLNSRKVRLLSTAEFDEIILCLDPDRTKNHILNEESKLIGIAPVVRSVYLEGDRDPDEYSEEELLEILDI